MNLPRFCSWPKVLLPLACLAIAFSVAQADEAKAPKKTVRLLTVGNSFSHNAVHYLGNLAEAADNKLILREAIIGGSTMQQHWDKAQLHEKDPESKEGLYSTGHSLDEELKMEPWDFVTIQQASIKSHDVSTYRPYAAELRDYIKKYAPHAELLLHETWEYRNDDPRFSIKSPKPGEPATQDAMYEGLSSAYSTIAAELGVRRIPTGDAFHHVNHDPNWEYHKDTQFEPKSAKFPALPDQTHSLNMGWQWKKDKNGKEALGMDGHHANTAGEYLGACCFYEVIFGESVVGNSFVPNGLSEADAKYLQQAAHDAVQQSKTSPAHAAAH
jgi:hypothetical protein